MTDKQIIIDGTQCRYASFDGGNTQRLLCAIDDCFCDGLRTNECYYKQLKRKEQECERLTLKCSQLEEEIKDWKKEVERIQFIGSYGIMDEVKKNTKLEQTLTEIKEIVQYDVYTPHTDLCIKLNWVKKKISEVEDE